MAPWNVAPEVALPSRELEQLESFATSRTLPHALVVRARIVLMAAQGMQNIDIARVVGLSRKTVGKWRQRFVKHGLEALYDEIRPGRPRTLKDERIAQLIKQTLESKPKGATHWSCRTMADAVGVSKSTVQRVWNTFGVQPHR